MFHCAPVSLIIIVLISGITAQITVITVITAQILITVITANIICKLFFMFFFFLLRCFILSTNEIEVTQIFGERHSI